MRVITYSTLSLRKIACAVGDALGIEISKDVISRLLESLGYSKQRNQNAVQSVRTWWYDVGQWTFPEARRLYITADGGGCNSSRSRLWKQGLARLAEETGLAIEVSHFPPGTSKWNKVEHRLFCYITANWAGQPLVNVATAVRLIGSLTLKCY